MTHHARQTCLVGARGDRQSVGPVIGERNLNLNVLSRVHDVERLTRVHLGGSAQDNRVDTVVTENVAQLIRRDGGAVSVGDLSGLFDAATYDGRYLHAVNEL
jgi:hypothetical protein